jgi:SAM-dependent methyltransferase
VAEGYARHRPGYPPALFDWLTTLPAGRRRACDAGTGSGQAAVALAGCFARVVAIDPALAQVALAARHPRVAYRVAAAEAMALPAGSIDLVTAAQAVHWFDLDRFYAEVRRVLAPGGALAVWTYSEVLVDPAVDRVVARFYHDVVGPYWPPERRLVERGYRTLPFPFAPVAAPELPMVERWDLARFAGYLGTWSAARHWSDAHDGADPLDRVRAELAAAWGDPGRRREVTWPLHVRAGRVP